MALQRTLLAFAVCVGSASAFFVQPAVARVRLQAVHADAAEATTATPLAALSGRRAWLSHVGGAAAASAVASVAAATPALAGPPVGEGGMPEGARQFSSVLAAQRDWAAIAKRVQDGSDVSDKEWQNIAFFLRRLYGAGDDMAGMAKGLSPSAQPGAVALIKSFKAAVKTTDPAVVAHDAAAVAKAYKETNRMLDEFLELFNDVPDEL